MKRRRSDSEEMTLLQPNYYRWKCCLHNHIESGDGHTCLADHAGYTAAMTGFFLSLWSADVT
jgi:hypothetical protein